MPEMPPSYEVVDDPSVADLPESMTQYYAARSRGLVANHGRYGAGVQQEHLAMSRQAIARTADEALRRAPAGEERRAVMLGPGPCYDIPLEELLPEFAGGVTLVEVDPEATEQALSLLPAQLLGRVTLVHADISGMAAQVHLRLTEAAGTVSFPRFIATATAAIRALASEPAGLRLEGDYTFACSQLVGSQLSIAPRNSLATVAAKHYGEHMSSATEGAHVALLRAMDALDISMQRQHVADLAGLVRPEGAVHYADTVGKAAGSMLVPMTGRAVIDEIDHRFTLLRPMEGWQWHATPSSAFSVLSWALAPRHP